MTSLRRFLTALALCLAGHASAATLYHGGTLLTLASGQDRPIERGYLLVSDDGQIAALGLGDGTTDPVVTADRGAAGFTTVDVSGRILLPGFVSGHSHLWQSVFRGITPAAELSAWLQGLHYTYGPHFAAGDFAAFTLHGAYDQLRHGVTTTYNHSHAFGRDFERYREQFNTKLTTPQRFVFAWVNDASADDATWVARLEAVIAQVQPRADRPLLGLCLNAVGLHRGPAILVREIAVAKKIGRTVQVNYLEPSASQIEDRAA